MCGCKNLENLIECLKVSVPVASYLPMAGPRRTFFQGPDIHLKLGIMNLTYRREPDLTKGLNASGII